MAKKWIAAMLVVCVGLGAGVVYMREQFDRKAPEIVCTDETVKEYKPEMSDAELLKGVKATDDKDGDVSDSLTVESVYEVDDSNVVVTYVAKDASNNIAKLKRNMSTDPEERAARMMMTRRKVRNRPLYLLKMWKPMIHHRKNLIPGKHQQMTD